MTNKFYNWKRFWCPRGAEISLADGGYLYDPLAEWGGIYNPNVLPFENISDSPCLVLLGEPGIGKSNALWSEQKASEKAILTKGHQLLWRDLRSYGSEDRLIRDLFENPVFIDWKAGNYQLYIFLDSLDECLLRIETLATLLIDELQGYPVERLRFRIACRTADWPNILEEGLKDLWGEHAVQVYELAPLRRVDVALAAGINGLDEEVFLAEIQNKNVVPLAIKPITLEFLLNTYWNRGELPATQTELYLEGCRLLCEESNDSRIASRRTGKLTADERLRIATHIAAATIFANRYAVWIDIDRGNVPNEDVTLRELSWSISDQFTIGATELHETLSTGLFSSRGPDRIGWAHHTYAEFLAARYLVENRLTLQQIMTLLIHPDDDDNRVVPQLSETGAWLATMLPEVFRGIMKTDPLVLLRSDVTAAHEQDRIDLVTSLLGLYEQEKLRDDDPTVRERFKKLAHPKLAEHIRPFIVDDTKVYFVRRAAIDIAKACQLTDLADDLVNIALDPSQFLSLREDAAYAVANIDGDNAKAKLKPLITGEVGNDLNDGLKGWALFALWPKHLTTEVLFQVITPPKRDFFMGSYQLFLSHLLDHDIQPADLSVALEWVERQGPQYELSQYSLDELADAIMLKAWDYLEIPSVLGAFAKAAWSRLKHLDEIVGERHNSEFRDILSHETEKRRRLLEAILPLVEGGDDASVFLIRLIRFEDLPWMIERIETSDSEETQRILSRLVDRAFDRTNQEHFEKIFEACKDNPILADTFSWLLKPVELNSPQAEKLKENYLQMQKWGQRTRGLPRVDPPPEQRIDILLDEFEASDLNAWWRLNREMTLEISSIRYGNELGSDLTVLPGWKTADAITKIRIIEAAKKYIFEQEPNPSEWIKKNILYRPDFAGYRGLQLLWQEDNQYFQSIPNEIWKKWAPVVLAYPTTSTVEEAKVYQELVRIAYQNAPDEIIATLILLIDKENEEHDHIYILHKLERCWDERLARALTIKVKDKILKPRPMGVLLDDLLFHQNQEAIKFALSLIPLPLPTNEEERLRAIVAARILVTHAANISWDLVWPAIQQDLEFGKELITSIAHGAGRRTGSTFSQLTEIQLANLYIWLVKQYPYDEDVHREGAAFVTPRESIADWRDDLLRHLKERGTPQAGDAIRQIINELPELDWLKWTLSEAKAITRFRTWMPLQPSHIFKLVGDQAKCLVQNGEQLLQVLIQSLERLEIKLQDETPAVIDLWNEWHVGKKVYKYRPKDENSLSDYIKRHFDEDIRQRGIIVNREVEFRRGRGANQGERTDIHVDAIVKEISLQKNYDVITVIIEVKGSWHQELNNAMETQLLNRYLKDSQCQHGIYLIGWFNCNQWDETDSRKKNTPNLTIDEVRRQFDMQAAKLSQQHNSYIGAFVLNTALR